MANPKLSDMSRSRLQQSKFQKIVVTTPTGDVFQYDTKEEYLANRPKPKVKRTIVVEE
jgi:hypothetical protein